MKQFLRYSSEHHRKIKIVYLKNDGIVQKNMEVLTYNEQTVTVQLGRGKPFELPTDSILACSYARGDNGGEDL